MQDKWYALVGGWFRRAEVQMTAGSVIAARVGLQFSIGQTVSGCVKSCEESGVGGR
jgi:hypothetical protein